MPGWINFIMFPVINTWVDGITKVFIVFVISPYDCLTNTQMHTREFTLPHCVTEVQATILGSKALKYEVSYELILFSTTCVGASRHTASIKKWRPTTSTWPLENNKYALINSISRVIC